jgi:hypothetical protein
MAPRRKPKEKGCVLLSGTQPDTNSGGKFATRDYRATACRATLVVYASWKPQSSYIWNHRARSQLRVAHCVSSHVHAKHRSKSSSQSAVAKIDGSIVTITTAHHGVDAGRCGDCQSALRCGAWSVKSR